MDRIQRRLRALPDTVLRGLLRGIEKEGLRTTPDGALAATPHPPGLGSALAHPHITTDYSESQLELITGVHPDAESCIAEITEIHRFVYRHIGDELIWGSSMPCRLPREDSAIPLGRYGSSNVGTAKTVYRNGLGYRYGRRMQTISGIHYNWSLPTEGWAALQQADGRAGTQRAYRDDAYFGLIRNFRRHSWLLLYLFGASPAVCRSFVADRPHPLAPYSDDTLYLPSATSLRMGPLGYQSDAQASLAVSYNGLDSYGASLQRALTEPYPPYEAIGVKVGDEYRQLATTLLQIENEFYGTIRPKRTIRPGERPLHALRERGVEYVEVRCMDVDPFETVGINAATMRMLDVFLLHCLLSESPPDTPGEIDRLKRNQHLAAQHGRDPAMRLDRGDSVAPLRDWGEELLAQCAPIAEALDAACGGSAHRDALDSAAGKLGDATRTPSAHVLDLLERSHRRSHVEFALAQSRLHRETLTARPLEGAALQSQERQARESLAAQRAIEAADRVPFETYRQRYLSQDLLVPANGPAAE